MASRRDIEKEIAQLTDPERLKHFQELMGEDNFCADLLWPSEVQRARRAAERRGWRIGKRRGGKLILVDQIGDTVVGPDATLREVLDAIYHSPHRARRLA